ncbi:hypothetical protein [Ramlibacter sp. WS9]|uniref:hypothetical protein n=1 Tax=Ramlibacter sp. WS9 TaxID=1882741 RepID=UPI0011432C23|nr:hypothetical protein [Ramlibacter sp. WS9]ROZ79198.1 hypothetical protein EEB15_05895 [Ramlibacter sp. WS9]
MNTTAATRFAALQPLVSVRSRVAAALAVVGVMALASLAVQDASHQAVHTAAVSFSNGPAHVTLAPVQIVGRRASLDANSI